MHVQTRFYVSVFVYMDVRRYPDLLWLFSSSSRLLKLNTGETDVNYPTVL